MKHNKRSKNDTKFLKLRHNWASSLQTGQGIQKIFFANARKVQCNNFDQDHLFAKVTFKHLKSQKTTKNDEKLLKLRHKMADNS